MSMHLRNSRDMMTTEEAGWWVSKTPLEQKLIILSSVLFVLSFCLTISVIVLDNRKPPACWSTTTVAPSNETTPDLTTPAKTDPPETTTAKKPDPPETTTAKKPDPPEPTAAEKPDPKPKAAETNETPEVDDAPDDLTVAPEDWPGYSPEKDSSARQI